MQLIFRFIVVLLITYSSITHCEETSSEPYSVKVWSNVLFDTNGNAVVIKIINESSYPKLFLDAIKLRLAKAHIQAPIDAGKPATFKTGVLLTYTITPSARGGEVKLENLSISPLPIKKFYADFSTELASSISSESIKLIITCSVDIDGRCKAVTASAPSGTVPEAARKYARDTMAKWKFEAQELNGKPVEGEFTFNLSLGMDDYSDRKSYYDLKNRLTQ